MSEKNKPAQTWRFGGVKGSLWVNRTEKDGREIVTKTLSVGRTYKDPKTGDFDTSSSYDAARHLPGLIAMAQAVYAEVALKSQTNGDTIDEQLDPKS